MNSKLSKIVIDVTVWLSLQRDRSRIDMDEGVHHIRDLIEIFLEYDPDCRLVNRFETEMGGEERMTDHIPAEVDSFKDPDMKPFISKPMVNSYRRTLHVRLAI